MSELKFTPAPWQVVDCREKAHCEYDYKVATKDGWLVAMIGNDHLDVEEANACLIAAAPQMYNLLCYLSSCCDYGTESLPKWIRTEIERIMYEVRGMSPSHIEEMGNGKG